MARQMSILLSNICNKILALKYIPYQWKITKIPKQEKHNNLSTDWSSTVSISYSKSALPNDKRNL